MGGYSEYECGHPGCKETKGTRYKGGHCIQHRAGEPAHIRAKRGKQRLQQRVDRGSRLATDGSDGSRSTIDRFSQVRELCTDSPYYEEIQRNSWHGQWKGQRISFNGAVDATPENTLVWTQPGAGRPSSWRPYRPDNHLPTATASFLQNPPQVRDQPENTS